MRKILVLVLSATLLLGACGTNAGREDGVGVVVQNYWARAALKDGISAAYMLLHNYESEDDALTGVSSDVVTAVEIHLSKMGDDGTMQMIPQESVPLPAESDVELKPGSYHIMMVGLKKDLNIGDEIMLTLHFKNHADITLTVPIQEAADMGGSGMDGMNP